VDGWFAIDTECTGLDPWGERGKDRVTAPCRPFAASLCNANGETAYLRWPVNPVTRGVCYDNKLFNILDDYLQDPKVAKVFFNAQYDVRMLTMAGFTIRGELYDTLIQVHTLNPEERHIALKPICQRYLQIETDDQTALKGSVMAMRRKVQAAKRAKEKGKPHDEILAGYSIAEDVEADYWLGDPEDCKKYAIRDAYRTAALHLATMPEIRADEGLFSVYERERRVIKVIEAMEDRGTRIDIARTKEVVAYYEKIRAKAKIDIVKEVGTEFNPNSPKQMTEEFFGNRGYKPLAYSFDKKKQKHTPCQHCKGHGCTICQETGKNPSCNSDFLVGIALKHETDAAGNDVVKVVDKLAHALLYESASDTMLAYAKNYLLYACQTSDGHIVHPNYKQVGTITGRLSCTKPNLQNVASDDSGKKKVDVAYRLRECFIPREEFTLYLPDYSQIEVWILFLRAKAPEAVKALAAGGDAHQIVANLIWGHLYNANHAKEDAEKDSKSLSKERLANLKKYKQCRKLAKNLQFCKIYGGGPAKIASMIGCSKDEALKFIADYDERLPDVARFMKETVTLAKRQGWIRNAYGRRYPIDRQFAYRATNYDIQGTAADLLKSAMLNVYDLFQTPRYLGKAFMLLSIHDELMLEIHKSIDDMKTKKDIAAAMGRDYKFLGAPILFPVGMKVANERWSESTEIKM
jgi:DNA polymerase-1